LTLYGPAYPEASFAKCFNILCLAKSINQKQKTTFHHALIYSLAECPTTLFFFCELFYSKFFNHLCTQNIYAFLNSGETGTHVSALESTPCMYSCLGVKLSLSQKSVGVF